MSFCRNEMSWNRIWRWDHPSASDCSFKKRRIRVKIQNTDKILYNEVRWIQTFVETDRFSVVGIVNVQNPVILARLYPFTDDT